jgi:hypothetical protein
MQAKFTNTLSILLLLILLSPATAFAQLFGSDEENWKKVFLELKKINHRLVTLETMEIDSTKNHLENLLREIEEVKYTVPQLQGVVELNKSETLSGLNKTNAKLDDLTAEVKNQFLSKIQQQNKTLELFREGLAQDMEKFMQSNKEIVAVLTQDLIPALSNENNKTRQSMLEEIEKLKFSQKRLEGKLDELLSKTKNKKIDSWNIYK